MTDGSPPLVDNKRLLLEPEGIFIDKPTGLDTKSIPLAPYEEILVSVTDVDTPEPADPAAISPNTMVVGATPNVNSSSVMGTDSCTVLFSLGRVS